MVRFFPAAEYSARIDRAANRSAELEIDALVITPGPDLRYLTGYAAHELERLTALVVTAAGDSWLVLPRLEVGTAQASPVATLDIELLIWDETDDPYDLVRSVVPDVDRIAVDDRMWAVKALQLRNAMPTAQQLTAGPVLAPLRSVKSDLEVAELQRAGAAVDGVHALLPDFLRVGRTEREVARDVAAALSVEHETADFVIIAAGANSASPHHEPSDYTIAAGDVIVVDIGGTTDAGYCSDSTRTYSMGEPDAEFVQAYAVLETAQGAARRTVEPGVACALIDEVPRNILTAAGLGEAFVHRTGHGIGIETHEDPYIVASNSQLLEPGMAFSIEPGFYLSGKYGARLEDIVVCTADGALSCNNRPRGLMIVE